MSLILPIHMQDVLLVILTIALGICLWNIWKCKKEIARERQKRFVPMLAIKIDTDNEMAFFIENTGDCLARNIVFEKTKVTLESSIEKEFGFVFEAVHQLQPKGLAKLSYHVYDGDYELGASSAGKLFLQIAYAHFQIKLHFFNLYQTPFTLSLIKNKLDCAIDSFGPDEDNNDFIYTR